MIELGVNKKNFSIKGIKNFRYKRVFFKNKYILYFFGYFRTPISEIEKIILNFEEKNFSEKNIRKIFENIGGICTLLIQNESEIKICASLYHSYLKIFNHKNEIVVTENEFNNSKKISNDNSFLKLFSHHSYFFHQGISNDVSDFLGPGSMITIKKSDINNYEFSWYLNFEKFCSRNDHDKIAENLASEYNKVFDNLDSNKQYFFALSGGLDSALAMSAAVKKNNIQPFHIARGIYSDELDATKKVSKFFNKKLDIIYKYNGRYTALDFNDDITETLNFNYEYIKKDSVFFFLHNDSCLFKKHFTNDHIFTGTGDPLLLTINHFMVYSDRIKKNFGYSENKDKRFFYSLEFFENLKDRKSFEDYFNFEKDFPLIDKYYFPLLSCYVDQLTKQFDYRSRYLNQDKNIDIKLASPITNLSHEQAGLFKNLRFRRAKSILKKILKSKFFEEKLRKPDPIIAQALLKFFMFLGQYGKETHQTSRQHDNKGIVEFTAMNTGLALTELSTIIDEKLVNFSKWHSFKAFEIMNGVGYEKIYYRPSLKNINYVMKRLHSKLRSKFKSLPEHDDKYALLNNKSLELFLKKLKIEEKYNDFKSSHDHRKLMYEIPTKKERLNLDNFDSNFWKINNIINIVSKID